MSESKRLVIELQYLPGLEFWTCGASFDTILLESHEHFQKQTFRNRCQILTSQGIDTLVVPVLEGRSQQKTLIRDIRIDYRQPWVKRHWGAIESAYRKTPFFEYFEERFKRVYERKPDFLFDLNLEMLTVCRELLRLKTNFDYTSQYEKGYEKEVFDARGLITPKISYQERPFYKPIAYRQNFGEQFFPNLSILDLLFCQGNEALSILNASAHYTTADSSLDV
ncbi:hypothetical protein BWI97_06650 [Siphonobacter sp. BAB-5405]|uniref:WbqC family protein n=1 Tax=Siphonobacter sp. BAB-5405 TaxID=1864825 RepID=UPI000C80A0DC|nr:WbqC family protein [Siphonobacter sp. BAB-5405]PMD97309.1 hypothetical protein BWI97_06650 [Siphonobacter sp. BAB-5405]